MLLDSAGGTCGTAGALGKRRNECRSGDGDTKPRINHGSVRNEIN